MRLPRHNMGGAQSLGQVDVGASGRKWAAETNAEKSMIGAFGQIGIAAGKIFDAQDDAEDSLLYQQTLHADTIANTDITTFLNNTPQVDVNLESTPLGVVEWLEKNKTKYTIENGRIATDKFSLDYLKDHYAEQGKNALSTLKDTEYRDDYVGNMTSQINVAAGQATLNQIKQRQSRLRAEADITYNNAVDSLDEGLALQLIEDNVKNKVWTPEDEVVKRAELGGQIDYNSYSKRYQSNNPGDLQDLSEDIWNNPNRMTNQQRMTLSEKTNSKIAKANSVHEAAVSKNNSDRSKAKQNTVLMDLSENGAMTWQRLKKATQGMLPEDITTIVTLNRSLSQESKVTKLKSNPDIVNELDNQILSLATLDENVTQPQAKAAATRAINDAVYLGPDGGGITGADGMRMMADVEKMEKMPFNSQDYNNAEEIIYNNIVGASKKSPAFAILENASVSKAQAIKMQQDLIRAMQIGEEGFSATDWVNENLWEYVSSEYHNNINTAREKTGMYAFKETTAVSGVSVIDLVETKAKIDRALKNKSITEKGAEEAWLKANLISRQSALQNKGE